MAAGWQNLPDVIFSEIMTTVGLESLGVLQKCRGVCKTWDVMICQMTRNDKNSIIREAEDLAAKMQDKVYHNHTPLLPDISTFAYLAHQTTENISIPSAFPVQWLLCSVRRLVLQDVDLASVPAEHLASLASCVKFKLQIINVRTTLVNILDNIKCKYLAIKKQSLGSEETQAMVQAMVSRVKNVELCDGVSVDVTTLTQYSGHGKCNWVRCYGDTGGRYREEVRSWGQRINWSLQESVRVIQISFFNLQRIRNTLDSIQEFVPGQPYLGQHVHQQMVLNLVNISRE